jgi:hypothetical protein
MIDQLQRRELLRVANGIAQEICMDFAPADERATIEGALRRRLDLASGRFALIDNGREFTLVPWRPVLEHAIGRTVVGRTRGDGGIDWTIGPERRLDI